MTAQNIIQTNGLTYGFWVLIYINVTKDKEAYVFPCGFCYHTNHHILVQKFNIFLYSYICINPPHTYTHSKYNLLLWFFFYPQRHQSYNHIMYVRKDHISCLCSCHVIKPFSEATSQYFLISLQSGIHRTFSFLPVPGTLVFGTILPPSSPRQWSNQANTLRFNSGFQHQHVHVRIPWWRLQVDTLWERAWDVCTLQRFLWRGKNKNYVFLSAYLSLCVEAAARDGLEEIYITKHPQVHREISMIQTGKDHQRLVPGCPRGWKEREEEEDGWKAPWLHTVRAWPEKRETFLSRMKGRRCWSQLRVPWYSHIALSLKNESAWCLQQGASLPQVMCVN